MYLRTLSIRNFRNLRRAELDFRGPAGAPQQWSVVVGENGTGKTSVLHALGLLLSSRRELSRFLGCPSEWVRPGSRGTNLFAEFVDAKGWPHSRALDLKLGDSTEDVLRRCAFPDFPDLFSAGYGAGRGSARPATEPTSAGTPEFSRSRIAPLFDDSEPLRIFGGGTSASAQRLRGSLKRVLPGADDVEDDGEGVVVSFGRSHRRIAELSQGSRTFSRWCGDLLAHIERHHGPNVDPSRVAGIVIVDELELHLDVRWQRQVRALLCSTFPRVQFVCSTHSAVVSQQANRGELFVVGRAGNRSSAVSRFPGAPSELLLHELLASPVFGEQPVESVEVQARRDELRRLVGLPRKSVAERRRLRELQEDLAEAECDRWRSNRERSRERFFNRLARRLDILERLPRAS
ncbi:MAG: AAA family ATPase [Myxococcales bacterium]